MESVFQSIKKLAAVINIAVINILMSFRIQAQSFNTLFHCQCFHTLINEHSLSSRATSGLRDAAFSTGPITIGKYCWNSFPIILHIRAQADIK